jgi:hypothetical protein
MAWLSQWFVAEAIRSSLTGHRPSVRASQRRRLDAMRRSSTEPETRAGLARRIHRQIRSTDFIPA